MEQFNLKANASKLLNKFNDIDFSNVLEIIEWFYVTSFYENIFLDDDIYKRVIETLSINGYGNFDHTEEYLLFLKKDQITDKDRIGKILVSEIYKDLQYKRIITPAKKYYLNSYILTYANELSNAYSMSRLSEYLGKNVVVLKYMNGSNFLDTGKLISFVPNVSININNENIFFDQSGTIISKISSEDGIIIYENKKDYSTDYKKAV